MATSALLNQVTDEFGGDTVSRIATTMGESPGKIKAALTDMLPAVLGGLASKAQTDEGAHELMNVIHRDRLDTAQFEHVADAIKEPGALGSLMNTGGPLLDTVLPGKSGVVSDWVASHSGINPSSSKSLMSLVLPLVLGILGRRVGSSGESGLRSLLGKPLNFLQDAPAGLSNALGMGSGVASTAASAAASTASGARSGLSEMEQRGQQYAREAASKVSTNRWLWPLLLLLALLALLWYFLAHRTPEPAAPSAATAPTRPPSMGMAAARTDLGAFMVRPLPDGTTLNIPSNGVENRLIAFIEDKNTPVSDGRWFSFDRLEFQTNSPTLKPSSREQLLNVVAIMKAYPAVRLKFGGFTDNTGDAQKNLALSSERATSAMNEVAAQGIDPARMSAEGYGEQRPVADNSTEEGRQRNRRVDVTVTAK